MNFVYVSWWPTFTLTKKTYVTYIICISILNIFTKAVGGADNNCGGPQFVNVSRNQLRLQRYPIHLLFQGSLMRLGFNLPVQVQLTLILISLLLHELLVPPNISFPTPFHISLIVFSLWILDFISIIQISLVPLQTVTGIVTQVHIVAIHKVFKDHVLFKDHVTYVHTLICMMQLMAILLKKKMYYYLVFGITKIEGNNSKILCLKISITLTE